MAVKKHISKQGISPLIATVLIIGFTVALAAIIINWGTGFTRNIQEGTESTTDLQIKCAQDVVFDVETACFDETAKTITIRVVSNGAVDIDSFIVRVSDSSGNTDQRSTDALDPAGIVGFGAQSFDVTYDPTKLSGDASKVELIPKITVGGSESQACGSNKQSFEGMSACS